MTKQKGILVISLDFELYWGVRDKKTVEDYKENLLGVNSAILTILKLFNKYKLHATWATVGFLFFETREELIRELPAKKPNYVNSNLSPYEDIDNIGLNEKEDPFHYAASLIKMITSFPHQEIGTHTFSHYYCLERGQNIEAFKDDLEAAIKIAKKYNLNIESLVFPRNQFNREYIPICKEKGIKAYRGNQPSWVYKAKSEEDELLLRKGLKFLDSYFNIFGHNAYSLDAVKRDFPFNIPASRFLRPYSKKLKILERLKLRRILSDLTYTAEKGLIYHLWWHPHNFGINTKENISSLKKILDHYSHLQKKYGMESLNMGELSQSLLNG